ncbi:MAG: trypsin-like peptidase domain-containing protein, partial [Oscillospiraceae bacterium]|nr:trypsin-like peptidase domain-containing protein [Oscillospiraceae bacterium]
MSDFENKNFNNGDYNSNQPNCEYKWSFEDYNSISNGLPNNKKNKKGVKIFFSIIGCLLAITVLVFAGIGVYSIMPNGILDDGKNQSEQAGDENNNQNQGNVDFHGITLNDRPQTEGSTSLDGAPSSKEIVKSVKPSVVAVVQYAKSNYGTYEKVGSGSGIIISQDGYIVTNAHVIEGAAGVLVVLDNGEEHEATIVGADTKTDIAVIKINAQNLVYAELGNSDQIEVGEWVIAIGNPGGLDLAGSVTKGIVSAVNRPVKHGSYTLNFIQTDAAINPGNSGGALVNEYGQVIGINSSKFVATDYEGIGFAIP